MNLYIQSPIGRENLEGRLEGDQVTHLWCWIISPIRANGDAKCSKNEKQFRWDQ